MAKVSAEVESLWNDFSVEKTDNLRHDLMMQYIWLVKYVLQQMNLPTNSILTEEDFNNIGILGLYEAIDRYDLARGVKFESFAVPRIKGIILDELRRLDWLSRSARKKAHEYLRVSDELKSRHGREVSSEEIRQQLNVTEEQYHSYLQAAAAAKASLSLNEPTSYSNKDGDDEGDLIEEVADEDQQDTLSVMENEERIGFINDYLHTLNERKRHVMMLYYYENLTFKEIGQVLSVSESRICQIHTQVVGELREKLLEFDNA